MIGEAPQPFDRNFLISFMLPAVLFVAILYLITNEILFSIDFETVTNSEFSVILAIAISLVSFVAAALSSLNYAIYRFFEGYGSFNPLSFRRVHHQMHFEQHVMQAHREQNAIEQARRKGRSSPPSSEHSQRLVTATKDYPDQEKYLQPTRFGNRYRAFEIYSRVVYGLDAVPAWPRLQYVLPKDAIKIVADSKSAVDFALNISIVASILSGTSLGFSLVERSFYLLMLSGIFFAMSYMAYRVACSAVLTYGDNIKSCFDLFRQRLAVQLQLRIPDLLEEERRMWDIVSRMMSYRSSERCSELGEFRLFEMNQTQNEDRCRNEVPKNIDGSG